LEEVSPGCDPPCSSTLLPPPPRRLQASGGDRKPEPAPPLEIERERIFFILCAGFFLRGRVYILRWCAVSAAGYVPLSWPGPAGGARLQAGAAAGLTEPVRSPPSTANSPCRWGPSGWGPACKRVRNVRRRGENTELPPGARRCGCWGRGGGSNSR